MVLGNNTEKQTFIRTMCLDGRTTVRGNIKTSDIPRSIWMHHFDPYLRLGPFKFQILNYFPFRSIFHDFFTLNEVEWITSYSQPKLSNKRKLPESTEKVTKSEKVNSNKQVTVGKAVQTWLSDIRYNETETYDKLSKNLGEINDDLNDKISKQNIGNRIYLPRDLLDPYTYHTVHNEMLKISKRTELATRMNITSRHSATEYQVTNYGLAGMVERHLDCWGLETGTHLPWERRNMVQSGDVVASFMGWIEGTKAGGATYFASHKYQQLMFPHKQAAAFWIDTLASGVRDADQEHGACPVLQGSKWILNKWIYHYNQWKNHPCALNRNDYIGFV